MYPKVWDKNGIIACNDDDFLSKSKQIEQNVDISLDTVAFFDPKFISIVPCLLFSILEYLSKLPWREHIKPCSCPTLLDTKFHNYINLF